MMQEIHIPFFGHDIRIYGYGLMLVVAFFACLKMMQWLGRRNGINPNLMVNAVLIALVTGIIGARLSDVLENFDQFTRSDLSIWQNFLNMVNIRQGGLTFYGGVMLATPCCILYAMYHRVPILLGMDLVAPTVMIGLAVGRIGCFMNGCCYGERCDLPDQTSSVPWGVRFPYYSNAYFEQWMLGQIAPPAELIRGDPQHPMLLNPQSAEAAANPNLQALIAQSHALPVQPAEIYSCITAVILTALLLAFFTLAPIHGRVFALMLILEGASRFILEILRVEPSVMSISIGKYVVGFSLSMILGLLSIAAGIIMWFAVRWQPSRVKVNH